MVSLLAGFISLFVKHFVLVFLFFFFFLMIRRPPRSTPFLHDALPISSVAQRDSAPRTMLVGRHAELDTLTDRKSTRLNSSHVEISYAVFCWKKKSLAACRARDPRRRHRRTRALGASRSRTDVPAGTARPPRARDRRGAGRFFFNNAGPTEIYTLSLHDALPI